MTRINSGRRSIDAYAAVAVAILAPHGTTSRRPPWWPILGLPLALLARYFL